MFDLPNGDYFRAVVTSDNLTTAAEVSLLDQNGVAITVASGKRVVISDIVINNGGTASVISIFQDQDNDGAVDAGELLYRASLAANGQNHASLTVPIISLRKSATATNGKIKVIASAASAGTSIILVGTIVNS